MNIEGIVMYVGGRESVTTKNSGTCPICRITLRDEAGAHRMFSLWRKFADTPAVVQAKVASTVLIMTGVTYTSDQGYSTTKSRWIASPSLRRLVAASIVQMRIDPVHILFALCAIIFCTDDLHDLVDICFCISEPLTNMSPSYRYFQSQNRCSVSNLLPFRSKQSSMCRFLLIFCFLVCSLIYPGSTSLQVFLNIPFSFTTAELHDIDMWISVMRDAPECAYVTKHLIGTPTKVDSVEADPVCPYCNESADN